MHFIFVEQWISLKTMHRAHHIVVLSVESNANIDKSVYSAYIHQNETKRNNFKNRYSPEHFPCQPRKRNIFISIDTISTILFFFGICIGNITTNHHNNPLDLQLVEERNCTVCLPVFLGHKRFIERKKEK